ncbi:MAG TPA: hypothetical protein VH599_09185 [Ktedonobacterales bacterium]
MACQPINALPDEQWSDVLAWGKGLASGPQEGSGVKAAAVSRRDGGGTGGGVRCGAGLDGN